MCQGVQEACLRASVLLAAAAASEIAPYAERLMGDSEPETIQATDGSSDDAGAAAADYGK